jgi:hypothetical protein
MSKQSFGRRRSPDLRTKTAVSKRGKTTHQQRQRVLLFGEMRFPALASADATKLSHPRLFLIFFLHTSACRTEEG